MLLRLCRKKKKLPLKTALDKNWYDSNSLYILIIIPLVATCLFAAYGI